MTARGATPLKALEAIAFDSETTGLDTGRARIVQLGAIGLSHGVLDSEDRFETFVDPGMTIPPEATRIHAITDAMIHRAPAFADAFARFQHYRRERVVIGYALGYDFAVLARECVRAGIAWHQPRSLCVRMLAAFANPTLPDHSLETLASWLGVTVEGRHAALADARTAAAIFLALVPRLADAGIRTLAEAERAVLGLDDEMSAHDRAGWARPVSRPGAHTALAQLDPYAYRHRVGSIMSSPVTVLHEATSASDAIALMTEMKISSVLVSADGAAGRAVEDYGIVTERDVMRRIAAHGARALDETLKALASRPLVSISDEAFVYRAMGRMERYRIRHLVVRDAERKLAGMISARDLLRLRGGAAIRLEDAIEAAGNPGAMARAWAMLPEVSERLLAEQVDGRTVAGIVSEELRVMTRRAAVLAEAAMADDGFGAAPCPYALLVLGSGGRGESLLAADQDNAIVHAEGEPGGPQDRWFAELGDRVNLLLDTAGIPSCPGGVMARNAQWRGSLETWSRRISHWVGRSEPQDLLNVDIFFDFRPVHGDQALGQRLFEHSFDIAHGYRPFAKLLGDRLGEMGSAFGVFGRLRAEEGRLDLKRYGLFPIVAFARALAIRHDLRHHRTERRLEALLAMEIGDEAALTELLDGHGFLVSLLLAQQARDLNEGVRVSNRVALDTLAPSELARLKMVLRSVERIGNLFRSLVTARTDLQ